jgi:putative component of membrane protein insertase Oxa1/YidC/SpoIIIJ protein YidD
MRFKLLALFLLPLLAHALPGFYEPWGKDADLYHARPETWNFERAKTAGIDDCKPAHISNMDRFTTVDSSEFSRSSKSQFQAARGISYVPTKTIEVQNLPHSWAVRMAEHIIRFHQNVLSPVDGPRSHFRPSSSSYMMQSMQKHGFIEGFLMGCDRLMRENSDAWVYRKIEEDGQLFKYDPPR